MGNIESTRRNKNGWPYKRRTDFERKMREAAAGYFKEKGLPVHKRYPFILSGQDMWPENIILPEVTDYILGEREKALEENRPYPLHKFIHHGLSSQALLFNLVGPLIVRRDLEPLRLAFEARGILWPEGDTEAIFEMEDRKVFNEQTAQPTSIDLVIKNAGLRDWLFVESKFTESGFGNCTHLVSGDCEGSNPAGNFDACYLHSIGRKYWTQLQEHGFLDGPMAESPFCPMASYYQFFREVLFSIHYNGCFVLLHDERNTAFFSTADGLPDRGIYPLMVLLLPEKLKPRVKRVTLQEVFAQVKSSPRHQDWTNEFALKYDMGEVQL